MNISFFKSLQGFTNLAVPVATIAQDIKMAKDDDEIKRIVFSALTDPELRWVLVGYAASVHGTYLWAHNDLPFADAMDQAKKDVQELFSFDFAIKLMGFLHVYSEELKALWTVQDPAMSDEARLKWALQQTWHLIYLHLLS